GRAAEADVVMRVIAGRIRAVLLRLRGASVGAKTTIGSRIVVRGPRGVTLGAHVEVEHDVFLKLTSTDARLVVGDYTFIGRGTEIDADGAVTSGARRLIARG